MREVAKLIRDLSELTHHRLPSKATAELVVPGPEGSRGQLNLLDLLITDTSGATLPGGRLDGIQPALRPNAADLMFLMLLGVRGQVGCGTV
ncbi:hypothetical protein [Parafrankia sp. FMc2]|uniref:hypothetical protein n=1 Tax=Parafrankia sp. FMc2 TaxID=3233196 RepID=UPI0034D3AAC2